jgi:Pectate lyase superfamily protein
MQTIWLSPAGFVTGDPTLRVNYPFVSHPSTIVSCTEPGDFKWVSMGLRLPPGSQIDEIVICYEVSNARSFIAQVRLAEMTTPDRATVIHDDPGHLSSTTPTSHASNVAGVVPSGAVTLELRLNFQDAFDEILLGAVGINVQSPNLFEFDTIADSGGLTSPPAPTSQYAIAVALGYWQTGDGGGGLFYWDENSTAAPDQGTVFTVPNQQPPPDPQTLPPGRWLRLYDGPLNVRWFGAHGDGNNDDTAAIKRALDAACRLYNGLLPTPSTQELLREPGSATVYFPPGTYAVASAGPDSPALTLTFAHSGVTLRGAAPGGQFTRSPSVIRLHPSRHQQPSPPTDVVNPNPGARSLLQICTTVLRVEDLWLDGNLLAQATVQFIALLPQTPTKDNPNPPALPADISTVCSDILFLRVFVTGAWWSGTPGTYDPRTHKVSGKKVLASGNLVHFAGQREFTDYADSEIDNVLFTRCQIRQYWPDPVVGLPPDTPSPDGEGAAGVAIKNDNGQAFMINFEHCWVANAETVVQILAGACHFRHCVVFFGSYAIFSLEAVQLMIIEDCYIEQSTVPFVKMENASGGSGAPPIIVRNCQINTASPLVLNCKQPVILEGNLLGGDVVIQPAFEANNAPPSAGWFPVVAVGNSFSSPNRGFVAPPGLLVEVANGIAPGASALFTNRIVSPVETYADSALANYDTDGLSLAVADGALAPTAGMVIAGDSHWITGLTNDRTYALSQSRVNLGSRMRISRVAAGDSNAVTIQNQSGTPLITLGSATGLGWADFLYVANNGWVLFAKGPA